MNTINEAMKNLNKSKLEDEILNEELLWEMANIHPIESGLPSELQSLAKGKDRVSHAARVKVMTPNFGWVSIQIEPEVKLPSSMQHKDFQKEDLKNINAAIKYIKKYKEVFLAHWNGEIEDSELHDVLRGIKTLEQAKQELKNYKEKNGIK